MAVFEVRVNGEHRFVGDQVTAITLVADLVGRRQADRISVHIGSGGPGERETHYLAANLVAGDEITVRVLQDEQLHTHPAPEACSFCGSPYYNVASLVAAGQVAICDSCLSSFRAVVLHGAALPVGAFIRETPEGVGCGFCQKEPPDVPAVLVRNNAAICPECLRSSIDLRDPDEE